MVRRGDALYIGTLTPLPPLVPGAAVVFKFKVDLKVVDTPYLPGTSWRCSDWPSIVKGHCTSWKLRQTQFTRTTGSARWTGRQDQRPAPDHDRDRPQLPDRDDLWTGRQPLRLEQGLRPRARGDRHLNQDQIIELVATIATANWTNRINDGLRTPVT